VRGDPLTGPIAITERPVLGDQIRRPIVWCEIAPCIRRHEDPAALGEADIRARAIGAGWRHDAAGRLVCPACQQRSPDAWAIYPAVLRARTPAGEYRQRGYDARGRRGRPRAGIDNFLARGLRRRPARKALAASAHLAGHWQQRMEHTAPGCCQ